MVMRDHVAWWSQDPEPLCGRLALPTTRSRALLPWLTLFPPPSRPPWAAARPCFPSGPLAPLFTSRGPLLRAKGRPGGHTHTQFHLALLFTWVGTWAASQMLWFWAPPL